MLSMEQTQQLESLYHELLQAHQSRVQSYQQVQDKNALQTCLDELLSLCHNTPELDPEHGEEPILDDNLLYQGDKQQTFIRLFRLQGEGQNQRLWTPMPMTYQLLEPLFEQAVKLQAFDLLENYLSAQIQWRKEKGYSNAWYVDELPMGHYAATALAKHNKDNLPLYVEHLASLETTTECEGTGEEIEAIFEQYGACEQTWPLVLARVTFAVGHCGLDNFSLWCKEAGLAQWIIDNNKRTELLITVADYANACGWDGEEEAADIDNILKAALSDE